VACGEEHTIVLTDKGTVFGMGLNVEGQIGIDSSQPFVPYPTNLKELNSKSISQIRAGRFSGAITSEG
jgi:alpha-tubulin suppressor-like RCC1 family protein